jgi:hypothetical protein
MAAAACGNTSLSLLQQLSAFFLAILCHSQSDDHPQEDLAKIKLNLKSQMFF